MPGTMKNRWLTVAVLVATLFASAIGWSEVDRKIVSKVKPAYPELARQMNLSGTVKIEVVIAANGAVKSLKPLGGHPLLIQSATDALRKWRYAPGPEQIIVVEFQFHSAE